MIERDPSIGRHGSAAEAKRFKAEVSAECELLDAEWSEVQTQIHEILQTRGKTEEQIREGQWQVEALLRRADQIHLRQVELTSRLIRE